MKGSTNQELGALNSVLNHRQHVSTCEEFGDALQCPICMEDGGFVQLNLSFLRSNGRTSTRSRPSRRRFVCPQAFRSPHGICQSEYGTVSCQPDTSALVLGDPLGDVLWTRLVN